MTNVGDISTAYELVDQHRALLAAVSGQIALAVALDVEVADHPGTGDWALPHPGSAYF